MLSCREFAEKSGDWLDGVLGRPDRLRMRVHLLACRHCRAWLSGLEATQSLVQAKGTPETAASERAQERFTNAIDRRLSQEKSGPVEWAPAGNDASIAPVQEPTDERVKRVFAEIEAREGQVPNLFRAYANNPQVLEHNWARVRSLMYEGQLDPRLKQGIAYLVSYDNSCRYCLVFHGKQLRELGVTSEQIDAMARHEDYTLLGHKEVALLRLAREANRDPHGTSVEMVDGARNAGDSEMEIVEALGIMELYCSFNRFLDTVKVPLDSA